jgi:4'-phosphopantetheinyl transferase EntD
MSLAALDSGSLCYTGIGRRRRRPRLTLFFAETETKRSFSKISEVTGITCTRRKRGALSFWKKNTAAFIFIIYLWSTVKLLNASSSIVMAMMKNQRAMVGATCSRLISATAFVPLRMTTTTAQRRLKSASSFSTPIFHSRKQTQPRWHRHRHQTFATTKPSSQEFSIETTTNNKCNEESPLGITSSAHSQNSLLDSISSSSIINGNVTSGSSTSSSSSIYLQPALIGGCQALLDLELPEGRCIGLQLADNLSERDALTAEALQQENKDNDHWLRGLLHPQEIDYGLQVYSSDAARQSFWMGRVALRRALEVSAECQQTECSLQLLQQLYSMNDFKKNLHHHGGDGTNNCIVLLKDEHGRPKLPPGALGSISHKKNTAVALVQCRRDDDINDNDNDSKMQMGIGVDIELTSMNGRPSIARRILTPNELSTLGQVAIVNDNENGDQTTPSFMSIEEEVLLRFSVKEALYKAMHPLINQFVSFQEAETQPLANGKFNVRLLLKSGAHENFTNVSAHWRRIRSNNDGNDFFITSASVQQPKTRRRTATIS